MIRHHQPGRAAPGDHLREFPRKPAPEIAVPTPAGRHFPVTSSIIMKVRSHQSDAMTLRTGARGDPSDDVRDILNLSLSDMAVDAVTRSGVPPRGIPADEVFTQAEEHTSKDFSLSMGAAVYCRSSDGLLTTVAKPTRKSAWLADEADSATRRTVYCAFCARSWATRMIRADIEKLRYRSDGFTTWEGGQIDASQAHH